MTQNRHTLFTGYYILLLFACVSCKLVEDDSTNIESEGLIPAYHVKRTEEIAGSGDGQLDEEKVEVRVENVNLNPMKCDCSKVSVKEFTTIPNEKQEPVIQTTTPSSVIVIIVILSIMVLVCIVTIAYLLGRIKYLNMRQKAPAPDKTADEYDSDEYSVMMDWNEHPNIVKNSKYRLKK